MTENVELTPSVPAKELVAPPRGFLSSHAGTLVLCLYVLFCAMPGAGFALFMVGLPWLIYASWLFMALDREVALRRRRTEKLIMGLGAFGVAFGLHLFHERAAREDANGVIRQIEAFKEKNGRFPAEGEIQIKHPAWLLSDPARYFISSNPAHGHAVVYHDTWVAFNSHWYSLELGTWNEHSG